MSSTTVGMMEGALRKVKNHVHFLNVTTLSELRIDGHPVTYNTVSAVVGDLILKLNYVFCYFITRRMGSYIR
ncbi:hypothetical protein LINGRAPRIM_LOCUS1470 [Linum grandiflorum]